jgi:glycerophosphoryl diester phosphodiesterase
VNKYLYHSVLLVILSLLLLACRKQENYPAVQVFGHAGMGIAIGMSAFHDNSLEAIQLALALPTLNGVEVDVRMSADGTLWLYHENTLESHTDGEGCIFEKTDLELEKLRYKSLHREKLARLDEIWPLLDTGHHIILDLKHWNACTEGYVDMALFQQALYTIPSQYRAQLILDSSNPNWLAQISQDFKVVYATVSFEEGLQRLEKVPALAGLMLRSKDITAAQITYLKSLNKESYLFEMRSSKKQRAALQKQPSAILADDPRGALVIRD